MDRGRTHIAFSTAHKYQKTDRQRRRRRGRYLRSYGSKAVQDKNAENLTAERRVSCLVVCVYDMSCDVKSLKSTCTRCTC